MKSKPVMLNTYFESDDDSAISSFEKFSVPNVTNTIKQMQCE